MNPLPNTKFSWSSVRQQVWKHAVPTLSALGWFLLRGKSSLSSAGLDWRVWLRAMFITALLSAMVNVWLTRSVDQSYYSARISSINAAQSTDEAVDCAIALCGADAGVAQQEFVRQAFRQRSHNTTCRQYLLSLISAMQGSVSPAVERTLDRQMTRQRSGLVFYVVSSRNASGKEAIEAFRNADPSWNHKTSVLEESGAQFKGGDAETFLAKFIDRVAQETNPAQRSLMRYNGWIQWWTICVCFVVLLLALNRAALLSQLVRDGWFPSRFSTPLLEILASCNATGQLPAHSAAEFAARHPLEPLLDRQVYSTYEFLIGLLPSLGFIGTVLGMGDALLSADSLFSAVDKNQAISSITSHLGFAFDTTLVGLITGIIAGSVILWLRIWESSLWHAIAVGMPAPRPITHMGVEPSHAI